MVTYFITSICASFFLFLLQIRRPPRSTLFPYTTLFRSADASRAGLANEKVGERHVVVNVLGEALDKDREAGLQVLEDLLPDRKSTRLNSSHSSISYAVFCLKKKIAHRGRRQHGPLEAAL